MVSPHNEFLAYVLETMSHWAAVSARKMFGGYGIYRDGLMFALLADEQLFIKADAHNVARFERAGSVPFVYQAGERRVQVSYWTAPTECLESPAEMAEWCALGYAAAMRADVAKSKKRTRKVK